MAKQTLGKTERLKSRKLIEQLFSEGKTFVLVPFRVYYRLDERQASVLQVGAGVSSRSFKKAVDRNRIKRLIREAWRLQKLPLQEFVKERQKSLHVFLIYTAKELPVYKDVSVKTGKIIAKLHTIVEGKK